MPNPNGQRNPVTTLRSLVHICYATIVGGGAGQNGVLTADAAQNGGGEIVSATRTGAGTYTIVFRRQYPILHHAPNFAFVDTASTGAWTGQSSAIDVTAGTATFVFYVGGVATDLPVTASAYVKWAVRTSNKN